MFRKAWSFCKRQGVAFAVSVALALAVGVQAPAQAAGIAAVDVTDVVSGVTNQLTSIAAIGVVILGLVVAIASYRWVRRVIK